MDVQYGLTPFVFYGCIVDRILALKRVYLFLTRGMIACSLVGEFAEPKGEARMEWVTPGHEEVDLNCEVSGYANAEL